MRQIAGRVLATFVYNATAVIGTASLLGGIPIWKAAVMAGLASAVQVVQKLASAYLDDGYLDEDEIEEAFDDEGWDA